MPRVLISTSAVQGNRIVLTDRRELHHLSAVLRLKAGDAVICFDGRRAEYDGEIQTLRSTEAVIRIHSRRIVEPPAVTIRLVQSLPKSDRFEWILQKATELGVSRISPVISRHTVKRVEPSRAGAKQVRWQRILEEASKQCGRAAVPLLDPVESFARCMAGWPATDALILLPTLAIPTVPLRDVMRASGAVSEVVLAIGPEGDFSREEAIAAQAAGAKLVSLGPLTLRSETAATATLAIVAYALGSS